MAAHVLHIGMDDCHRVAVLRSVGYYVDECASLAQLAATLQIRRDPQALFLTDCEGIRPDEVVTLARQLTAAPVIFFPSSNYGASEDVFDLVIPPLTAPEKWLKDVNALLEWSRDVRADSLLLTDQARTLRKESSLVRRSSEKERERSMRERTRNSGAIQADPWSFPGRH